MGRGTFQRAGKNGYTLVLVVLAIALAIVAGCVAWFSLGKGSPTNASNGSGASSKSPGVLRGTQAQKKLIASTLEPIHKEALDQGKVMVQHVQNFNKLGGIDAATMKNESETTTRLNLLNSTAEQARKFKSFADGIDARITRDLQGAGIEADPKEVIADFRAEAVQIPKQVELANLCATHLEDMRFILNTLKLHAGYWRVNREGVLYFDGGITETAFEKYKDTFDRVRDIGEAQNKLIAEISYLLGEAPSGK